MNDNLQSITLYVEYSNIFDYENNNQVIINYNKDNIEYSDIDNNRLESFKEMVPVSLKSYDYLNDITKKITTKNLSTEEKANRIKDWVYDNFKEIPENTDTQTSLNTKNASELNKCIISKLMLKILNIPSEIIYGLSYDNSNSTLRPSYWLVFYDVEGKEQILNTSRKTKNSKLFIPLLKEQKALNSDITKINLIDVEYLYQPVFYPERKDLIYTISSEYQLLGKEEIQIYPQNNNLIKIMFKTKSIYNNLKGELEFKIPDNSINGYIYNNEKTINLKLEDNFILNCSILSTIYPIIYQLQKNCQTHSFEIVNPLNNKSGIITLKEGDSETLRIEKKSYYTYKYVIPQLDLKLWIDKDGTIIKMKTPDFTFLKNNDIS
jgi:hypothetical protein